MVGHFGYCILANWRLPFEVASRKRQSAIAGGNKINMTHALRFSRFSTATFLHARGEKQREIATEKSEKSEMQLR